MTAGETSVVAGDLIAGRYRIEAWIGQGNMAVVYRAKHEGTGRLCALKLVHPHLAQRKEIIELFLREAQVGARIGQSPYIIDVLDAGVDPARGLPFLAMELLQGQTLDVRIREHGPMDPVTFRILFEQLAEALDQAHAAGVVHRDLKPGNLFLIRNKKGAPSLKIVDFGIAKVLEQEALRTATQVGSPAYAAPEQMGPTLRRLAHIQGITIAHVVSPATDVWALGLVAYELLSGLGGGQYWNQFDTINDLVLRVVFEVPEPPSVRAGPRSFLLPPGFDDWFSRCLRKNAAERWASAGEAVQELARLLDGAALENLPTRKLPSYAEIQAITTALVEPAGYARPPSEPHQGAAWAPGTEQGLRAPPDTVKLTPDMFRPIQQPTAPAPQPFLTAPAPPPPKPTAPPTETQPPGLAAPDTAVAGTKREPDKKSLPARVFAATLVVLTVAGVVWMLWPRSGSLQVDVRAANGAPVERAEIYIDGQRRCERAPCEVADLSPGLKTIKAITAGQVVVGPVDEIVEPGKAKAVTLKLEVTAAAPPQERRADAQVVEPGPPGEASPSHQGSDAPRVEAAGAPPPGSSPTAPSAPPTIAKPSEKMAILNINSIPVTKVLLDGRPLGNTPRVGVLVAPGPHKIQFIHPSLGKKTISVSLMPGEKRTASTKFN